MNTQSDSTKMKDVWGRLGGRHYRVAWGNFDARLGVSGVGDFVDQGNDPLDKSDDFRDEFWRVGADLAEHSDPRAAFRWNADSSVVPITMRSSDRSWGVPPRAGTLGTSAY
jgi:hypothetical protein